MKPVLFLLTACALLLVVFASPHNIHVARHHAIAARAPVLVPAVDQAVPLKRRQNNRRCKQRPPSSSPSVVRSSSPLPRTSSTVRAPNPSPTSSPNPTTTTPVYNPPAPSPTATHAAAPASNLPSFMTGVQTGQGTFYDAGLGACGITNKDSDFIVAVSWRLFDNYPGYNKVNPNSNPVCGKRIRATYQGRSTTVTVTDRCADDTCLVGNLDFSKAAFSQLASFDLGRLFGMTWEWV